MPRWLKNLIIAGLIVDLALVALLFLLKRRMPSVGDEESDSIALSTVMDKLVLRSRSRGFTGGSVTTVAGATILDLRRALLADAGASLRARSFMGALVILVPDGWRIDFHGRGVMGAADNRTRSDAVPPADAPTLTIDALAVWGAVEVAHKPTLVDPDAMEAERSGSGDSDRDDKNDGVLGGHRSGSGLSGAEVPV